MDALEQVRSEGYAQGLLGNPALPGIFNHSDEFARAYQEGWIEGSLASMKPEPQVIVATYLP